MENARWLGHDQARFRLGGCLPEGFVAISFRKRLAVQMAGIFCLVLGLFPYYSHKSVTATEGGVPRPKSPAEAATPVHLTRTCLSVGLPISPVYWRQWDERTAPVAQKSPAPEGLTTIKMQGMVVSGNVSSVAATISDNRRVELFCWSSALALLGAVLLLASFFVRGGTI